MAHFQFTTRRLLALPPVFATVFGLFRWIHVPAGAACVLGLIAGGAFSGIILCARDGLEIREAVAGFSVGLLTGLPLARPDPCMGGGELGFLMGPLVGYLVIHWTRLALKRPNADGIVFLEEPEIAATSGTVRHSSSEPLTRS